jgi:PAS domain S-box-containing protein
MPSATTDTPDSPDPDAKDALYRSIFDQAEACFALMNRDGCFLRVNAAFARAWGQPLEAFPGRTVRELYPGDSPALDPWEIVFHHVLRSGEAVRRENRPLRFRGQEARVRYFDWITQPLLDPSGRVQAVLYLAIDVTERQRLREAGERAERDLQRSAEQFQQVFDHASSLIYVYDVKPGPRFLLVAINPAALAAAGGAPAEEFIGRHLDEINPQIEAQLRPHLLACLETTDPVRFEDEVLLRGGRRNLHTTLVALRDARHQPNRVILVAQDVTQYLRAQERIEASERQFRSLAENTPDYIARWDLSLRRTYVNPRFARAMGRPAQELLGTDLGSQLGPVVDEQTRASVVGLRETGRQVIASGAAAEFETWYRFPADGDTYSRVRVVPEFDAQGRVSSLISIGHDLTALKRTEDELRRLNLELERRIAERTAQLEAAYRELETFAYLVSHDLKAPLRGIEGYGRLLEQHCGPQLGGEGPFFLHNIRAATVQMGQLIDDLLAYSRIERLQLAPGELDLEELLTALVRESEEVPADGAAAPAPSVRIEAPAIRLRADREGLQVILRNLLSNARKFTRGAAAPAIQIGARRDGPQVLIWVRDNGIGFDMRFHDRIFEIFQRLQRAEDYAGTGVGLALVRRAAQRMGGRVWAQSAPGQGACFYLELPQ